MQCKYSTAHDWMNSKECRSLLLSSAILDSHKMCIAYMLYLPNPSGQGGLCELVSDITNCTSTIALSSIISIIAPLNPVFFSVLSPEYPTPPSVPAVCLWKVLHIICT